MKKIKRTLIYLILLVTLALLMLPLVMPGVVNAFSPLRYTLYTQVTLDMYVLNRNGSIALGSPKCQAGDLRLGCTYFPEGGVPTNPYPFGSLNPVTISIDSGTQGYLRNVVPNELDPSHAASSVRAQAIAARTYANHQIDLYGTLNNSSSRQVYIPYSYDILSTAHKGVIDQALAGQVYLSLPGSTNPIAAYFSDNTDVWTDQGATSYLKSVYDPISRSEGFDNPVHELGGMGQKAAGRWGAGRTNEYPGGGSAWTVRWDTAQQILAHYYTGINFIGLSPDPPDDYRFNILEVPGLPSTLYMRPGESITDLIIYFQNTGASNWPVVSIPPGGSCPSAVYPTYLSYHLYNSANSAVASGIEKYGLCQVNSGIIQPGVYAWVSNVRLKVPSGVPPGNYKFRFDVQINGRWLSGLPGTNHWPTQDIDVVVSQGGTGGSPEVSINHPPAVFTTDVWRKYGQRFGFSWNGLNGANYFDVQYRSREFFSTTNWDSITWTAQLNNNPTASLYDYVYCNRDRREYQFQVRGQIGSSGSEGPWRTTYTNLKVYPFLSISNVQYAYAVFFKLDPIAQTYSGNLYVTNAGGGTVSWQVTDDKDWINLSPTSGTDDGIVSLSVTKPGGLGVYQGLVTFTITGSNPQYCNPSQNILMPVNVYVLENIPALYLPVIWK